MQGRKVVLSVVGVVFLIGVILFIFSPFIGPNKQRSASIEKPTTTPEELYTHASSLNDGFVLSLSGPDASDSSPIRIQMRGTIWAWQGDDVLLQFGQDRIAIQLPRTLKLVCVPKIMPDEQGDPVETQTAYIDISRYSGNFKQIDAGQLSRDFAIGTQLNIVVDKKASGSWVGDIVIGSGCKM